MIFSERLKNKGIISTDNELAWKREDIFDAINEITKNNFAILGGDAWAIVTKNDNHAAIAIIDSSLIALGIIPGKDNNDYVLGWSCDRKKSENWNDYVMRTKEHALVSIEKNNLEKIVADEFKDNIYYNLVYADQTFFE